MQLHKKIHKRKQYPTKDWSTIFGEKAVSLHKDALVFANQFVDAYMHFLPDLVLLLFINSIIKL
jgi:hypothetical protein